ncbi:hypothetical protein BD311DRAFT_27944 [Dichomitus squalens]|uniref:Uncharacterized protein n=1 Tax=Dichomitus squalens TaxID=114155 RepID=A0A4Q9MY43_9APHY|nr:hypothetical protein BD311DRAFT_27944 [Dichomitus squalens]
MSILPSLFVSCIYILPGVLPSIYLLVLALYEPFLLVRTPPRAPRPVPIPPCANRSRKHRGLRILGGDRVPVRHRNSQCERMDDLMLGCRYEINKEAALPRGRRAVQTIAVRPECAQYECQVRPGIKDGGQ